VAGLRQWPVSLLGEAPDERERGVGDLPPAAVNRQGVSAAWDLHDFSHAIISPLSLERRVRDRPRDRVVLLTGNDQQRAALRVIVEARIRAFSWRCGGIFAATLTVEARTSPLKARWSRRVSSRDVRIVLEESP
jgi:hypothetical protein